MFSTVPMPIFTLATSAANSITTSPARIIPCPKLSGVISDSPWWNTSHGPRPTAEPRTISAMARPYTTSPTFRCSRRRRKTGSVE